MQPNSRMSKAKVQRFLALINQPATNEAALELLIKLTSPFDAAYFVGLYNALPEFTDDQMDQIEKKAKGSFGELYICKIDGRICYKIVDVNGMINKTAIVFSIFKEIFIQYFLAQDQPFGTQHVPAIRAIYKSDQNAAKFMIIEMERMDETLYDKFASLTTGGKTINFSSFYKLTKNAFILLKYFNETYGFVHRDFKINNIMFKRMGGELKMNIIDFGASCLTVTIDDTSYIIKALGVYREEVPCLPQQDVSLYFMSFVHSFNGHITSNVASFIRGILIPKYLEYIDARVATPKKIYTGKRFWASYNIYGNLFTNPEYPGLSEALDLDRVLTKLDNRATHLGIPILAIENSLPAAAGEGGAGEDGAAAGAGGGQQVAYHVEAWHGRGLYGGRRRTKHKRRKTKSRRG